MANIITSKFIITGTGHYSSMYLDLFPYQVT